jgi:O-antigen ligase
MATMLVGTTLALTFQTAAGSAANIGTTMAIALLASFALAVVLGAVHFASALKNGWILVVVGVVTMSGVGGLFQQPPSVMMTGVFFVVLLGLRNYVCFIGIPYSRTATAHPVERAVLMWTLVAIMVVIVGSLQTASVYGVTLRSSGRLTGEGHAWLNANTTGLYCAYAVLICAMARFLRAWVRLTIAALAAYSLILTQSRTAMLALLGALVLNYVIVFIRRKALGIVVVTLLIFASLVIMSQESASSYFGSIPQIAAIQNRFTGRTLEFGRSDVLDRGMNTMSVAPIFGLGYAVDEARFENGYLNLACETGIVGLTAYLLFVFAVLVRSRRLLKAPDKSRQRALGQYLACSVVFLMIHALGERSHLFQLGTPVANCSAMLAGIAFGPQLGLVRSRVVRRPMRVHLYPPVQTPS